MAEKVTKLDEAGEPVFRPKFSKKGSPIVVQTPVFSGVSGLPPSTVSTSVHPAGGPPVGAAAPWMHASQLDLLGRMDPVLGKAVSDVRPLPAAGVPRNQLTVPVSSSADVVDTVLFEAPADPAQKYYLPRYRLATQETAAGTERYLVALRKAAQGWELGVRLQKFSAPEIEEAARAAAELPHRAAVILQFTFSGETGIQEELLFAPPEEVPGGLEATLQIATLAQLDLVHYALREPESNATLIVRREIDIAVPVPPRPGRPPVGPPPVRPRPNRPRPLRPRPPFGRGGRFDPDFDPELDPELLEDRGLRLVPGASNGYRAVTRTLDNPLPFTFSPELHGYIFEEISPPTGPAGNLFRWQLQWNGQFHSYYQETGRRNHFHYLPDSFKLARWPEPPRPPSVRVRIDSTDGTPENTVVTMSFVATPFVDTERLLAAAEDLKEKVPSGSAPPVFEPASSDRLKFRLALPGGGGLFQLREGAEVNLKLAIVDRVQFSATDFEPVWDAMMGSAVLMRGEVEVGLGGADIPAEKINFVLNFRDLNGEIFDSTEQPDPASGGLRVNLTNGIESPVRITALSAQLRHGVDATVPAEIRDVSLPVDHLAPGESVSMLVAPLEPIEGSPPMRAEFDFEQVTVLPDRLAIWDRVLEPTSAVRSTPVTIKTLGELFEPPADGTSALREIDVELKVGDSVLDRVYALTKDVLAAEATLPFPASDFIIGRVNRGEYQYRVTSVRPDAARVGEWKPKAGNLLWILAADLP